MNSQDLLIHQADPQSRPVVITILVLYVLSVRPSLRPFVTFQNRKTNKVQERKVIAAGVNASLAEWIIDGTHVLFKHVFLGVKCYAMCPHGIVTDLFNTAPDHVKKNPNNIRPMTTSEISANMMEILKIDKNGSIWCILPDEPIKEIPHLDIRF